MAEGGAGTPPPDPARRRRLPQPRLSSAPRAAAAAPAAHPRSTARPPRPAPAPFLHLPGRTRLPPSPSLLPPPVGAAGSRGRAVPPGPAVGRRRPGEGWAGSGPGCRTPCRSGGRLCLRGLPCPGPALPGSGLKAAAAAGPSVRAVYAGSFRQPQEPRW